MIDPEKAVKEGDAGYGEVEHVAIFKVPEYELEFLEKAIGKKVAKKDLPQIQKILKDNQIPTEDNICKNLL